ncbi:acetyl-CoA C-acetyltransferase [Trypanosoma conorhini]|uniref:Acetyl-CoA C-acetyltransferase n=1 Tax=Trypanosoma conorhini TaxID=83891 RepID=A0A422PNX4_9TRYP|nr:acetyl-CoA C-acetyltransferase [Trypanosoma conorhini]RNF19441.1 acetyl-CoA C-acetyltransferase [Trypanosoma conorhini]
MSKVVVCGGARSPIGSLGGGLAELLARPLITQIAKAALLNSKCDANFVDYMTLGRVMSDGRSPNLARMVCEDVGAPVTSGGTMMHENCASGGAAIHDVARRILLGEISVGMAGGVESMSNTPRYLYTCRVNNKLYGDITLVDGLMQGLTDCNVGKKGELMGLLTERLVEKYGVSRGLQDEIAFRSHENAMNTWEKGMFDYVTPLEVPDRKGVRTVARDEGPKKLDMAYFAKQKPYFKPEGGTITAANSSSMNDGAAVVVLASEAKARELGLPILAELRAYGNIGVPKELMGEGAFKILPKIMDRAGMKLADVDYFEMNEAFAAVVGAGMKAYPELNVERINLWGSGISLGHPVGCTGVRQVVDMVYQLRKRGKSVGVTSRCVGGGMGSGEVLVLRS